MIKSPLLATLVKLASTGGFLLGVLVLAHQGMGSAAAPPWLVATALAGGSLALALGANNAANNIAIAVGAGALGLGAAWGIAAIGELAGAFLAGEAVTGIRLREEFIDFGLLERQTQLHWVILGGILAAGLWLHVAFFFTAPVSATHSVIGGLAGAAVAAQGWQAVKWDAIGTFALAWIASPVTGALLAALALYGIKHTISYKPNPVLAARDRVPILVALMALVMANYLLFELAHEEWHSSGRPWMISLAIATAVFLIAQPLAYRTAQITRDSNQVVNQMFALPLILATGFFTFAHGANDVANVAGPLTASAAIPDLGSEAPLPLVRLWALAVGGIGITVGLVVFGGRMVRTVGTEITELDMIRGFCISLSAATVVLLAVHFGLPVSTTHTLVGSIVGVGLLREYLQVNEQQTLAKIRKAYAGENRQNLERFLGRFQRASLMRKRAMLADLERERGEAQLTDKELQRVHRLYHRQLVKRVLVGRILLFWLLTLPVTGLLGAAWFYLLAGAS